MFPAQRPRRLRRTAAIRRLVAETTLSPSDFVAPLFVGEGLSEPRPISSLPGHFQHTLTSLTDEVKALHSVGVSGVILFGVPEKKDETGSGAWDPQGISQVALRTLRNEFGDDVVLIGRQGDHEISAASWARAMGTIAYTIVCGICPRVPRVYVP